MISRCAIVLLATSFCAPRHRQIVRCELDAESDTASDEKCRVCRGNR
jgi:hypothetical protein